MVLVIDNFDSFTYNLVQLIGELGQEIRVFRNDAITPREAEELRPTHIVISPGPGAPEQAGVSMAMVRHFAGKLPLLGVCLGHQAIAAAFGATIGKAKALMHGKASEIEHDGRTVFSGLPPAFPAVRYHSLAVHSTGLPACLELSAWTADGEIMGLRHRQYEVEGVQFHPESVGTAVGRKLLQNFLERRKQSSTPDLRALMGVLVQGQNLGRAQMEDAMRLIMDGEATAAQIGAFLVALRMKGESVTEIAAAARVMREKATSVRRPENRIVVDTCGTGGDGAHTFNISTTAALVAAGAGLTVAKHGNRSVSSRSGSADVLAELGVNLAIDPERMGKCLEEAGVAFLFAPTLHSAMRHVMGPRREIGIRTLFNILGPLANPARADAQLLGVYDRSLVRTMAEVLVELGVNRAMVVHGGDGLDEITLTTTTHVASVRNGQVTEDTLDPRDLGLDTCRPEDLAGGDPEENARITLGILSGEDRGPRRSVVILNAGAAIHLAGSAPTVAQGCELAGESIDSGKATAALTKLRELSNA